jgi:hypothetical protein
MPGSPVFHGIPTSTTAQGVGGANRVQSSASGTPSDMNFFVWVFIIGILIPVLLIGGLQIGGFQFVFRR